MISSEGVLKEVCSGDVAVLPEVRKAGGGSLRKLDSCVYDDLSVVDEFSVKRGNSEAQVSLLQSGGVAGYGGGVGTDGASCFD